MRSISIGIPSGIAKLTLWEGTEDEEKFEIKYSKKGVPYVVAYGKKYWLIDEEIRHLRELQKLIINCEKI